VKFGTKKKYCTQHLKIKLQDTIHKQHWEIKLIKYFILNTHSDIIIQSVQQKVAKLRTQLSTVNPFCNHILWSHILVCVTHFLW
jgi:hypothetical protein